ncbi:MAG: ParB/RepB/Spo0J family partition protein [bacterium]
MAKKALGRGLGALIPTVEDVGEMVREIDVDAISPNPYQPRQDFDEAKMKELAKSIEEQGMILPILVRANGGGGYELVSGERRIRAAKIAGLKKVPCIVREIPDEKLLEVALIENIQREDLNPIEEAEAYRRLEKEFGLTHEEIAKRVGKDRSTITNALRLLRLPRDVRDRLADGSISPGHARALLGVDSAREQIRLCRSIIEQRLPVRAAERLVRRRKYGDNEVGGAEEDPQLREIEGRLREILGTRVRVRYRNGRGKIEIEFYTEDEFNRILEMFSHR